MLAKVYPGPPAVPSTPDPRWSHLPRTPGGPTSVPCHQEEEERPTAAQVDAVKSYRAKGRGLGLSGMGEDEPMPATKHEAIELVARLKG